MSYVWRIPVEVKNLNPLAGGFINGLSHMALHGLCTVIEQRLDVEINQFAFVISRYAAKLGEQVKQSMDQMPAGKQAESPPMSADRHADMSGALYLKSDDFIEVAELAEVVMSLRVQGGSVMNYLTESDIQMLDLDEVMDENSAIKDFIYKNERAKLSVLHKKSVVDHVGLTHDVIARMLIDPKNVLLCTGFVVHDEKQVANGETIRIAEPVLTLGEVRRVYELKKEESFNWEDYFFAFNKAEYDRDSRVLSLN